MDKSELHPALQELIRTDEIYGWDELLDWFGAVAAFLYWDGSQGWYGILTSGLSRAARTRVMEKYVKGPEGPVDPEAAPVIALYDYWATYRLTDEEIFNFGQYLWAEWLKLIRI